MTGVLDTTASAEQSDSSNVYGSREEWLLWADSQAKDDSLQQALRNPLLRAAIQPKQQIARKRSYGSLSRLYSLFIAQIQTGCSQKGKCSMPFCRSNPAYVGKLTSLSQASAESMAVELARRAAKNPSRADIQPHCDYTKDMSRTSNDSNTADSDDDRPFARAFNSQMLKLLGVNGSGRTKKPEAAPEALAVPLTKPTSVSADLLNSAPDTRRPALKLAIPLPQKDLESSLQMALPSPSLPLAGERRTINSSGNALAPKPAATLTPPPSDTSSLHSMCDDSGNPYIAIYRLDAQTAPLVSAIGGRLLRNTIQIMFSSFENLSRCFVLPDKDSAAPFAMDMDTALRFVQGLAGQSVSLVLMTLRQGVSEIETKIKSGSQAYDLDTIARTLAISALVLATLDQADPREQMEQTLLQLQIMRLILHITFFAESDHSYCSQDFTQGWQARFAYGGRMRERWIQWWAVVPAAVVLQWIKILKDDALGCINQLQGGLTSDRVIAQRVASDPLHWAGSLELLRLLDEANKRLLHFGISSHSDQRMDLYTPTSFSNGTNVVRRSAFQDSRILQCFDIRQELMRWIACMKTRSTSLDDYVLASDRWAAVNVFSPFAYPFLFSLRNKIDLLVPEMHERMSQRYLQAHDRQAELVQHQRVLGIDTHAEQVVRPGFMPEWPLLASNAAAVVSAGSPYLVLAVRRQSLLLDAFDMMAAGASHVRFPLKVRFVASGEDGVDMGGVQKELFAQLLPQLLSPDRGLFVYSDTGSGTAEALWPNAASPHSLADFEIAGMFIGVAFANNIPMDTSTAPLAKALISQMTHDGHAQMERAAHVPVTVLMERLRSTFPTLVAGLAQLLEWDENDGAVEDVFSRSFDITVSDPLRIWHLRRESVVSTEVYMSECSDSELQTTLRPPFAHLLLPGPGQDGTITFPLIDNGDQIDVTAQNREYYVRRYLQFVAFEHARAQIDALRRGFARAVDSIVYRMLSSTDLVTWLSGMFEETKLDVVNLEQIAEYDDEYTSKHPVIRRFWRVVGGFTQPQLKQLLMFVTASDHLPLGGYSNITFVVQRNGPDSDRLPTALTCFGRLLLPAYSTDQKMRDLLLMAIENSSGFGLV